MSSQVIETLADLVRINSVNPAYEGGRPESEIVSFIDDFFAARGVETFRQDVFPERPNLVARIAGRKQGRRIIFEAHTDTASVTGMTVPPFDPAIHAGRLYGRGACDTKAGLAAMMEALASLRKDKITPACEIWVVAAADEEFSYRGVLKLCENLNAAAAVVSEPTGMKAVIASKGCLRLRIECLGRAAHSSKPELGVNAISRMVRVIDAIEQNTAKLAAVKHPLVGAATCNIGMIEGGTQVNIVPERCAIALDRRLIPGEDLRTVKQGYQRILDELAARFQPFETDMTVLLEDVPLETAPDSNVAAVSAAVLRDLGLDDGFVGVPFGSDASKLSRAGVPSVVIGPGSIDQAHAAEEFVECEQVEQAFEFYRGFMRLFE